MERNQKPVKKDKTMKITKSQLKQIIKEELEAVLLEYDPGEEGRTTSRIANELLAAGYGNPAGATDVAAAIDAAVLAGVSDEETLKQEALSAGGLNANKIATKFTNQAIAARKNKERQMAMKKPAKPGFESALGDYERQLRRNIKNMRRKYTQGRVPPQ
jgi:hypothetical protein